jgi:hypothetical protein
MGYAYEESAGSLGIDGGTFGRITADDGGIDVDTIRGVLREV